MNMRSRVRIFQAGIFALSLVVVLSGCSPAMRKKFVRKKKKDITAEDTIIPVLEPQDYPEIAYDPSAEYKKAYALLQVWQKDLLEIFRDGAADKQVLGRMEQISVQLDRLRELLAKTSSEKSVLACLQQLADLKSFYDQPESFRQRSAIEKRILHLGQDIRKNLSYEVVKTDVESVL